MIELLVVVAILAVLASAGLPLAELSHRRNKEEDLRRSLRELRGALDAYKRMVDTGFIVGQVGGSGYPPRLQVLVEGVDNAKSPQASKIYLVRKLPRGPFRTRGNFSNWHTRSICARCRWIQ